MQKSQAHRTDVPALLLMAIATLFASGRLVVTDWVPDLQTVANLTRIGLVLGFALGYSQFKKAGIILLTLGYSIVLVPWQIYTSVSPLLKTNERIYEMSARTSQAFVTFIAKEPVKDHLLVLILMGLLFWSIALYASFVFIRYQHGLAALLPSTFTILALQYNDHTLETPIWMLGVYFFFALLLFARLDYLKNHEVWKKKNFFIVSDVKIDLSIFSTVAIAVLILFTWNLPSSEAEWKAISRWWDKTTYQFENTRKNLDNLFSSVDNPVPVRGQVLYGPSLKLGERSYQGTSAIAIVDVPEIEKAPPRYYWRVRSYDTYLDGTWSSSADNQTERLPPQKLLPLPVALESETATFTFTTKAEMTINLLMPHQSYLADVETFATYTLLPDNTIDLNLLRATETLRVDDIYSVQAAPLAPTVAELRSAGTDYPEWVTERYLQLPNDLAEDIRELAYEITQGKVSPYDKARAITTYLRAEIEYNDTIPTPPVERDPLEWFLFTWQEGYCNYSASAEVVMLRSVGIPARLVVGFAQGQKVEDSNYVVIQKDAHAWPEVYFPNIGWVEFEPTGNQTALIRPIGEIKTEEEIDDTLQGNLLDDEELSEEELAAPNEQEDIELPPDTNEQENSKRKRLIALFWGIIILVTVVVFFGNRRLKQKHVFLKRGLRQVIRIYERRGISAPEWLIRWLAWLEASRIERAFHAINRSLRWLEADISLHLTPRERAEILETLLPERNEEIMQLLNEHEKTMFTPSEGDIEAAQHASKKITWAALKRKTQKLSEKTG